jgi:osmotically-inducible protein OsmY
VDIILQTAIAKRLNDSAITRLTSIHVRVEDRTVILTGTAKAEVRDEAERIARQTELNLNGESIRPNDPISNRITTR